MDTSKTNKALLLAALKERERRNTDPDYVVPDILRSRPLEMREKITPDPEKIRIEQNIHDNEVRRFLQKEQGSPLSEKEREIFMNRDNPRYQELENQKFDDEMSNVTIVPYKELLNRGIENFGIEVAPMLDEEDESEMDQAFEAQEKGKSLSPRQLMIIRMMTR